MLICSNCISHVRFLSHTRTFDNLIHCPMVSDISKFYICAVFTTQTGEKQHILRERVYFRERW